MPSRSRQIHVYDQHEIDSLKGVTIPQKIKCGRCRKNLPHIQYSTKQLTDYRYQVKHNGNREVTKPINCMKCSGGSQIVELECQICHKTKGLEDFAKSQRKQPDTACTADYLDQEPIRFDRYEGQNPDHRFVTPDTFKGYVPEYWSSRDPADDTATEDEWKSVMGEIHDNKDGGVSLLTKNFKHAASISGSEQTLIEVDDMHRRTSKTGCADGWSDVHAKSWHTESTGPTSVSVNSRAHPPATSYAGTHSYTSSVAERSDISEERVSGWGYAGAPRGTPMLPAGDAQRACEEAWKDEDESDDEEEDEGSDDSDGENTTI
ncbi:Stc1 domain-containing protein [Ampelomyces quisqualis]|uniref:Stc1 domain-containing protein n=1 Tax=Ampelomyces quisqualis TaxID=50730 RepID=A0A6A5QLN7_AMPQU|nr:Stc1 domain-containing protein [Ampelomyces quisqualis]